MPRFVLIQCGDGETRRVELVRRCRKNSRVRFDDGHEELVPTSSIVDGSEEEQEEQEEPNRIIPLTPLHHLYRRFRELTGSEEAKFRAVRDALENNGGPGAVSFLAGLFGRSVRHFENYNNESECFVGPAGSRAERNRQAFAFDLVHLLLEGCYALEGNNTEGLSFKGVGYEVSPYTTTRSCFENGDSARSSGVGGMDVLLCSQGEPCLPIVGEVKAKTEAVGPTFALVQSLKYAAELATESQWRRLRRVYEEPNFPEQFPSPLLDIYLFFEGCDDANQFRGNEDFDWMEELSRGLMESKQVTEYIRRIVAFEGTIERDEKGEAKKALLKCIFRMDRPAP